MTGNDYNKAKRNPGTNAAFADSAMFMRAMFIMHYPTFLS